MPDLPDRMANAMKKLQLEKELAAILEIERREQWETLSTEDLLVELRIANATYQASYEATQGAAKFLQAGIDVARTRGIEFGDEDDE